MHRFAKELVRRLRARANEIREGIRDGRGASRGIRDDPWPSDRDEEQLLERAEMHEELADLVEATAKDTLT